MNNILENITNFVDTKITPPLVKFGSNKYMVAMRNALIRLIPLLIVGSFSDDLNKFTYCIISYYDCTL